MTEANLRRRSPRAQIANGTTMTASAEGHTNYGNPIVKTSPPYNRARSLVILAGSILLATASWMHTTSVEDDTLPESYALCSPDGRAIYTVDDNDSKVQCLLVHGDRIFETGSLSEVTEKWIMKKQELHDAELAAFEVPLNIKYIPTGSIVVPGMSDSHGHTLEYGASRLLALEGSRDSAAAVARVRDYILADTTIYNDTSRLIESWGWDHTAWSKAEFPSFKELEADPIVRGRPIVLQSKDGHAQWVSEVVLKSMLPLPDKVEGGIIERDDKGNPTGVFLDNAQDLIKKPPLTDMDRLQRFKSAVNDALSKGLTSFHDAGLDPVSLEFFKRHGIIIQSQLGKLPASPLRYVLFRLPIIRIHGMSYFDETAEYWGDKRSKIIDENRLTARSVKIFADGALRSGGAAVRTFDVLLFEPYADNPGTNGFMRIDPEVLYEFVPKFVSDGWQVNIHAIGDRANSIILDVLESVLNNELKGANDTDIRPRIEHVQIIRPEDTLRLAKLGVIASIQPTHAVSDMWYAQDRLGPERVKNLYAFRTIIDAGARITLGSDFPVEDMNPLAGFHAAITRVAPDGRSPHGPDGWFPEQQLTRIEALRGVTIDPAYASFSEKNLGSLEPGKIADYVVLSQDIMSVEADKIIETRVLATVLDGRPEYGQI
ncbi:amidohydrolase family-domain-containing protein [Phellopilus nigrolimitatus]|nr:amidohydrolase family-domain-containing protein [Phellopilus nigrolimitatus]